MEIVIAVAVMGGLGFIFGAGLAFAARRFSLPQNAPLEDVFKKLPGVNCGMCGKGGCREFAEALLRGECTIEQCRVCKAGQRDEIRRLIKP